jgi:hypothetical protein
VQRKAAEEVLRAVRGDLQDRFSPAATVVRGRSWEELLGEAERERHTLIAVGSHGIGRARGIVVGSTATEVAHKARCSVLVARKARLHFPRRIVAESTARRSRRRPTRRRSSWPGASAPSCGP